MRSQLFEGELLHQRCYPCRHGFRYPVYGYAFALDELADLSRQVALFGYNRPRPVSLHDRDYLGLGAQPIGEKLRSLLGDRDVGEVWLITSARYLGYIFNPVSFYFCYATSGALECVVAEVNNTFGERHAYLLDALQPTPDGFVARQPKAFYVSPFNAVEGDYEFQFADPRQRLDIQMRVWEGSRLKFYARLRGQPRPLTNPELLRTLVRFPLNAWLTIPRIHWEAARLYFRKGLKIVQKLRPTHVMTLRAEPPTPLHRFAVQVVRRFLEPLLNSPRGQLSFDLPNGQIWRYGTGPSAATVRVQNWDLFLRLLWDGDVALGDGYVAGQWDSPAPEAVLRFLLEHRSLLDDKQLHWTRRLARVLGRLNHWRRRNSVDGSRRNIEAHYDLGNELYRRFLDSTMSYSCAYYAHPQETLEAAQRNKMGKILERARLGAHDHVLEVGCGWGSLAIEAVRATGCRWTGITLSREQLEWARAAVERAGLADRIDFHRVDYREVTGSYSRIVSVEMLEAVGHSHLGEYFAMLERCLAPDGLAVLQVITSPDFSYSTYLRERDWIQKEIFPGACVPSQTALLQAMSSHSQLRLEEMENIGPHYARTLRDWRQRFQAAWPELAGQYDERFRRAWTYYLSYCEAGFATLNLATLQMVLARPMNARLRAEVPLWL